MSENFKVEPRSRKYEGLAELTKEVATITKDVMGERGFVGIDLITNWTDIIGAELAQGVLPVRLTFPMKQRSNGALHVRTAGGPFALLFEHQKNRVIERINTYFGYPAISEIRIVQGAVRLPEPEPEEVEWPLGDDEVQDLLKKVDGIEDDTLRAKAFDLGVALIRKRNRT
ncbi:MAG: DUF721 domain-containing protein [Alphaproteobacteria bacterium]|nr:DUF721 domain-containing protein [Alphaproteobacteria bacterium]